MQSNSATLSTMTQQPSNTFSLTAPRGVFAVASLVDLLLVGLVVLLIRNESGTMI